MTSEVIYYVISVIVGGVLVGAILWWAKSSSLLSVEKKKREDSETETDEISYNEIFENTEKSSEELTKHTDEITKLESQKMYATCIIIVCFVLIVCWSVYSVNTHRKQEESNILPSVSPSIEATLTPVPTDIPTPTNTLIPTPTPQKENSTVTPGISDKNIEGNNAIDNKRIELSNNSFPSRVEDRMTEDALSTPFKGSSVEVIRDELIEELSNPVWVRAWFEYLSDIVDEETSKAMKKYIDDYDTSGLTPFYEAVLAEDGSTVFYLSEKYLEVIATYYDAIRGANIKIIYDVETKYTWNALSINLIFDETIPVIKKEMVIADQWNDFAQVTISIAGNEYTSYINLYDKSPAILK